MSSVKILYSATLEKLLVAAGFAERETDFLEMGLDMDGAGANACNESCCFEYKGCLITAASKYRENFIFLGSSLAASGGALGSLYGSIIPFIGTSAVGLAGGILGGVTGFVQAVNVYMKDQEACTYNYKACILRKGGN